MKNFYKSLIFTFLGSLSFFAARSQPGLLDELEPEAAQTERVTSAFKSPRVINGHSMEMLGEGVLDFRILHRFGRVNLGLYEMLGLDQASMRMGFDYGIVPNLTVGIGRSTLKKEYDAFVKYRILWQSTGQKNIPLSLVWVSGASLNSLKDLGLEVEPTFSRRLAFYNQLIIGRKFSDHFSLQLTPTHLHRNVVDDGEGNDLLSLGLGARYKITRRMALVVDYYHAFNREPNELRLNPLSIGIDIETGGHVFQLHFSNAPGMNERAFLTDANGSWADGDVQFGFNLSRVFQLKKQKL